jgi:hypothetical protein
MRQVYLSKQPDRFSEEQPIGRPWKLLLGEQRRHIRVPLDENNIMGPMSTECDGGSGTDPVGKHPPTSQR